MSSDSPTGLVTTLKRAFGLRGQISAGHVGEVHPTMIVHDATEPPFGAYWRRGTFGMLQPAVVAAYSYVYVQNAPGLTLVVDEVVLSTNAVAYFRIGIVSDPVAAFGAATYNIDDVAYAFEVGGAGNLQAMAGVFTSAGSVGSSSAEVCLAAGVPVTLKGPWILRNRSVNGALTALAAVSVAVNQAVCASFRVREARVEY